VALLLLATPIGLLAQGTATGSIAGRLVDESDAVVPQATVTVINTGTLLQRRVTTSSDGAFVVPLLPPGTYVVRAEHAGFARTELANVQVQIGDQIAVRIQMKVAAVQEVVNVTAGARIQEAATVGTVISRAFVENLPLSGRSFQSLIQLTPGVVLTPTDVFKKGQFSVNGQREGANYVTIDGVSANVGIAGNTPRLAGAAGQYFGYNALGGTNSLVSIDAVEEFKIQTSMFAPEFGRTPGAQISIVTRSGTNEWHGTLFEYFRHDRFDAADWFANSLGLPKSRLRQNQFGGVLGGPIRKNRLFFFASYEGVRLDVPRTDVFEAPTVAARQSARGLSRTILDAFPLPTGRDLGDGLAEYAGTWSEPSRGDTASVRLDTLLGSKVTVFGRYSEARSASDRRAPAGGGSAPSVIGETRQKTRTVTAGATAVHSSRFVTDLRFNYSNNAIDTFYRADDLGGAVPPPESTIFTAPYISSREDAWGAYLTNRFRPLFYIGNIGENTQRQFNAVTTTSAILGSHQLRLGADYRRLTPILDYQRYRQFLIFDNVAGVIAGDVSGGWVFTYRTPLLPEISNLSLFAQDTWRPRPRLTLTYGVRWEYNPPPTEARGNNIPALNPFTDPTSITLAPAGTPLWRSRYTNFAPRVGVAHQLSQSPRFASVIRGGVGLFFDIASTADSYTAFGYPNAATTILPRTTIPLPAALAEPQPFPNGPPYRNQIYAFDPEIRLPYTTHWNAALEQHLGSRQSLTLSYVGAAGRRLSRRELASPRDPAFEAGSDVFLMRDGAVSDYHALQVQFSRPLSRGLQALASYTWSSAKDSASDEFVSFPAAGRIDPDSYSGPSDFDVRHSFSAALSYDLPGHRLGGTLGSILGHWSIDSIFRARSAVPVNVFSNIVLGGASFLGRPDLVPGVPLFVDDPHVAGGRRINRAAFVVRSDGNGTAERNLLRGFPASQLDLTLRRDVRLGGRLRSQLRIDVFNVLNHPNFANPDGNLASSTFGRSTQMLGRSLGGLNALYQMGGPRSMQFGIRLQF
jgi:hypothetical protein